MRRPGPERPKCRSTQASAFRRHKFLRFSSEAVAQILDRLHVLGEILELVHGDGLVGGGFNTKSESL